LEHAEVTFEGHVFYILQTFDIAKMTKALLHLAGQLLDAL
jgi:hypothetical protein